MPSLINAFDPREPSPDRQRVSLLNRAPPIVPPTTPADAYEYNAPIVADAARAAQSPEFWTDAARQYGQALLMGTTAPGFRAFHGSPHSFDRFDTSKIGTGEGAQAYGHGLYTAGNESVARGYRDELAGFKLAFPNKGSEELFAALPQPHQDIIQSKLQNGAKPAEIRLFLESLADGAQRQAEYKAQGGRGSVNYGPDETVTAAAAQKLAAMRPIKSVSAGHMYEVQVNADPAHFLDWDKPLSEQTPHVQDAYLNTRFNGDPEQIALARKSAEYMWRSPMSLMNDLEHATVKGSPEAAAAALRDAGIPGIRYLDQGSRASGEGTSNHVIFDANTIEILRKYGIAGLMAGGAAAATQQQPEQ